MIQKRYKQTEALAQAEALKETIEGQEVSFIKLPLADININGEEHFQNLVVKDVNVAASADFIKISPKRVLTNKTTGKELQNVNLFVPKWEIEKDDKAAQIDENGERILHEMEYYDDETGEVVTPEDLPTLEPEKFLLPTIPYVMFLTKQSVLMELVEKFAHQYINDNIDVWNVIDSDTQNRPI